MMERNNAIGQLKELDSTYIPPSGFQFKNAKLEDKVMLPAEVRLLKLTRLVKASCREW